MNYTSNHHLPQWSESDRVRMEDFNSAMTAIDTGLTSAIADAKTASSKAEAAYSPGNLPYVIGSYTGNTVAQFINLGWMPSFLIITGMKSSADNDDNTPIDHYFAIVGGNGTSLNGQMQYRLHMVPEGFVVYQPGNQGQVLPLLNEAGRLYYYIAFR